MSRPALYLGEFCPPNMEAYLDSLLYRTNNEKFDILTTDNCQVPEWLAGHPRLIVKSYTVTESSGIGRIKTAWSIVHRYLTVNSPTEVRQITQPHWHAPGVILGTRGFLGTRPTSVPVYTRTSASMFEEYHRAPSKVKAFLVNNCIGRSLFFADRVYTPKYGGVTLPSWSSAELVVESRVVNEERFHSDADPHEDIYSGGDRRVLTVGRISQRKGSDLVLKVAARMPDWEFAIVGPGSDSEMVDKARSLPNVIVYPPVDYHEMPGLYVACDIVLSTSRIEWGGVSRAMLEGKASGKKVVALDRGHAGDVADKVVPAHVDQIVAALRSFS